MMERIGRDIGLGMGFGPLGGKLGAAYDAPPAPEQAVPAEPAPADVQQTPDAPPLEGTASEMVDALLQAAWQMLAAEKDPLARTALLEEAKGLMDVSAKLNERKLGLYRIDENTVIPQAQLDAMAPGERAQVEAIAAQQKAKTDNEWIAIANKFGLDKFDLERDRLKDINSNASQDFQNSLAEAAQGLGYDTFDLNQAVHNVERSISGLGESRSRAKYVTDTQSALAPYSTGGRTQVTTTDIGASPRTAALAGYPDGGVIDRYPVTTTIDPASTLSAYDAGLGVDGPLPTLPTRTENRRSTRPSLLDPSLLNPPTLTPPVIPGAPGAAPAGSAAMQPADVLPSAYYGPYWQGDQAEGAPGGLNDPPSAWEEFIKSLTETAKGVAGKVPSTIPSPFGAYGP